MKKKRVGIIARGLTEGGVGKFLHEILNLLNNTKYPDTDFYIYTDDLSIRDTYKNLTVTFIPKTNKLLWDLVLLPSHLFRDKLDVVIYTKNIIPLTHLVFKFKKIIVIYDLGYLYKELHAYKFWDTIYMNTMLQISLLYADKIMAISNFTKSEILKFFKTKEDRIFVNPLGVNTKYIGSISSQNIDKVMEKYALHIPFVFYVGSMSPRKNLQRTLSAFTNISNSIPHYFYIISSRSWNNSELIKLIDKKAYNRVEILSDVSEEELISIYTLADALIYPSLYEGFGLPIIEAQAAGCKVVTSSIKSSIEVSGGHAFFHDPTDPKSIQASIVAALNNKDKSLELQALNNAFSFKWENTVSNLLKEIRNL